MNQAAVKEMLDDLGWAWSAAMSDLLDQALLLKEERAA
jgi:hypothetical protein